MTNANGGYSLADCPGYVPDHQAMGDCRNCGHLQSAHTRRMVLGKVVDLGITPDRKLLVQATEPYFELGDGFVTQLPPASRHDHPVGVDLVPPLIGQAMLEEAAATGLSVTRVSLRDDPPLLEIFIPGEPMWSARMRVATIRGRGRLFEPKENAHSKKHIVDHALAAWGDRPLTEEPIALTLETVWEWPASWSKKKRERSRGWKTSRPDLDNIVKIYKDALNGVVWKDDCQVVRESISKRYGDRPSSLLRLVLA